MQVDKFDDKLSCNNDGTRVHWGCDCDVAAFMNAVH